MNPRRSRNRKPRDRSRRDAGSDPDPEILREEVPEFSREYPKYEVERRRWMPWAFLGLLLVLVFYVGRGFLRMVDGLLERPSPNPSTRSNAPPARSDMPENPSDIDR